jgi:asparagine synthase (glutamine-hydrolysing)
MCGISGVIYKNKNKKDYKYEIESMNALITHRGPDDNGIYMNDYFTFGHTRLSIIDISNAGHQPMKYLERYIITYNGEVYNYLEIKDELLNLGYTFKGHSDTEVILAGYAEWKEKIVDKLNGMFAFAIYDLETKQCFIARDRTGVKPLYYYETDNEFYFFSEPKQIIISNILKAKPNNNSIKEYLSFQFVLSDETFFQGVKKLLPGHFIKYQNRKKTINQYWSIDNIKINNDISYNDAKDEIKRLVEDAVKLRLRSDVSIGCYLSGGIDSSVVSSVASQNLKDLNTYTFTSKAFPKQDESELAKKSSNYINSNHHEIELKFNEILKLWKESVYYMDEPELGYSLIPQMEISKKVSENLKVVLGGQGGDELFYGYSWHTQIATSFIKNLKDFSFTNKLKTLKNILITQNIKTNIRFVINKICSANIDNEYFNFWKSNGVFDVLKDKGISNNFYKELNYDGSLLSIKKFEYKYWLTGLLHVEDRSSMYASLESRVPLLDYRIAEYVFTLPPSYMINGVLNKILFIDSFKDKILPEIYLNTQKKGYSSPINEWFKVPEVKKFIYDIINDRNSFIYNYIVFDKTRKFNCRELWMLISLEIWYKTFVLREFENDK